MNIIEKINFFFEVETQKKPIVENLDTKEDVLIIARVNKSDKFVVYDNFYSLKYTVKGKSISLKPYMNIYDKSNKKVATLKQIKSSLDKYVVHDLILEIDNNKLYTLRPKNKFLKNIYNLDNGWSVEEKKLKLNFEIKNFDKTIAKISRLISKNNSYLITFPKLEDELLILSFISAIAMYDIIYEKSIIKTSKEGGAN